MPIKEPEPGHDRMCGRRIWGERSDCGCAARAAAAAATPTTTTTHHPHACCEQAQAVPCVCAYAYYCPVHGTKHIGSHE